MKENAKTFLELLSKDEELRKKVCSMTQMQDIIALAKELGIELTEEDLKTQSGEISEEELSAVTGGGECYCAVGGGGTAKDDDNACGCVALGFGTNERTKDDGYRCFCSLGGWGGADVYQR